MTGLSSSERQTLEKAIDSLTLAVKQEDQGCPPHQALRHYCRGLQLLLPLLVSSRCSGQYRHVLQEKCRHYWSKIRLLRSLILSKSCRRDSENSDGAEDSENSHRSRGAAARLNNDVEAGDLSSPDEPTAASPGRKKTRRAVTYRPVHFEVATVEVAVYHDSEEEESEDARSAEQQQQQAVREAREVEIYHDSEEEDSEDARSVQQQQQQALREAREVEVLASQFFPTYTEGGDHDAEMVVDTEDARRQRMVQSVLDAMVNSNAGRGLDLSWVKGPWVGLQNLEIALREHLVLPLTFPKIITGRYCPYLLLYGQPGDGILPVLSYLHKAWATYQFLLVSGHSLLEAVSTGTVTERDLVEGLFSRAFLSAPCALCVTDFDVLGGGSQFEGSELECTARRLKTELLVQLETLRHRQDVVIFVAVTSRPWLIDPAVRRRFSYRGYCPCPMPAERAAVLVESMKHIPYSIRQEDLWRIAERTPLFSRADMRILADEAHAMVKLRVQEARHFRPLCSVSHSPSSRDTAHSSSNPTSRSQNEGGETTYRQGNSTQGIECCRQGTAEGPGKEASEESNHKVEQWHTETDRDGTHEDATDQCGWDEENLTSPGAENPGGSDQGAQDSSEDSGEEETDLKRSQENVCDTCSSRNGAGAGNDARDEGAGGLSRGGHTQCSSAELNRRSNDNPQKTSAFLQENCDSCVSRNIASAERERDKGAGHTFHHRRRKSSQADPSAAAAAAAAAHAAAAADDASTEADSASWPEAPVMYTPCRPWDEGARPMTWLDVDPCRLREPDLSYEDVVAAMHHVEGGVDEDDARRLRQWHEVFSSV